MDAPYQVMPPLAHEEFESLKADIAERGVQVPVEYDEAGVILDGHHRVQACLELGVTQWPRLIRHGFSEQDKRRHARRLNLDRRHLNSEQKRALIAQDLKENPEASDRAIGAGLNVDHKTVGATRLALESTGEIPQLTERAGRDKRVRRITQFVPSNPAEEKGLQLSVKAINWRNEAGNRENRRNLARELSEASVALSPDGQKVACLYADPPWHRKQGVTNRSYENHYPTMTWDEICAMPVAQRLLPDAWLFLWIPRAHMFALHGVPMDFADDDGRVITRIVKLPLAWAVARAWGFDAYSTAYVWTKTDEDNPDDQGGGVIAYDQDEMLLMFKRGRGLPKPATDEKYGSNHRERKREHSRKPDHYREMIRTMTGGVPVLELFARVDADNPLPPDWIGWGNQAGAESSSQPPADGPGDEGIVALESEPPAAVDSGDPVALALAETASPDRQRKLDQLPSVLKTLIGRYGLHLFKLHHCVVAGNQAGAAEQADILDLLQERANGNTTFGMGCAGSPAEQLRAENAAPIGQEPLWHQRGIFRLNVDDIPHIVAHDEHGFGVHAEDADKPFLSSTGYRSFLGNYMLGVSVAQHAEALIRHAIDTITDTNGRVKPRSARTAMGKPECVYRLPTTLEGGWEAIAIVPAIVEPPAPIVTPPVPVDLGPLTDDEIEQCKCLAAIADGGRLPGPMFDVRDIERGLIGDGYLEVSATDSLTLTDSGRALLNRWPGRLKPARRKASDQIDLEDLLQERVAS